jgi:E3 ubiquitin-protein ligase TRIP12
LLEFLLKIEKIERKEFLLFVTGSTRLPQGGFKNLSPKLTIVKKCPEKVNESPDSYLPTVMT